MIRKIIYFFYYLKITNYKELYKFTKYASENSRKSRIRVFVDIIISSFRYNCSFSDYFHFKFYEKPKNARAAFAGTGFMYNYQLKMNPKESRNIHENKIEFLGYYKDFISRQWATAKMLEMDISLADKLLNNKSKKIVLKKSNGVAGKDVKVYNTESFTNQKLIEFLKTSKYNLAEEFVIQHDEIMKLAPNALNTIRIITQITKDGEVAILGARFRISAKAEVDNMAQGGFAGVIDIETGEVISDGIYFDITKPNEIVHPITKVQIKGFKIPHWDIVIEETKKAALFDKRNRSIGWDVAITNNGVEFIEGNHNWGRILLQLPTNTGIKTILQDFL